jgi:hypothetical protein
MIMELIKLTVCGIFNPVIGAILKGYEHDRNDTMCCFGDAQWKYRSVIKKGDCSSN